MSLSEAIGLTLRQRRRDLPGTETYHRDSARRQQVLGQVSAAQFAGTGLARELLLKAAQEHPKILEDPAPIASFEGFGDNALNFSLRCYLPNLDNRLVTITELHTAIGQAFRKAGITIAFPQRDLHLDSIHPLEVRGVYEQIHTGVAGQRTDALQDRLIARKIRSLNSLQFCRDALQRQRW